MFTEEMIHYARKQRYLLSEGLIYADERPEDTSVLLDEMLSRTFSDKDAQDRTKTALDEIAAALAKEAHVNKSEAVAALVGYWAEAYVSFFEFPYKGAQRD